MSQYRIAPPLQILQEACKRAGFSVEFIGEESGHLAKVSKRDDFFYSGAAGTPTYPLNNAVSHDLCADKAYSYELLKRAGLSVPDSRLFFPGFEKRNQFGIEDRGIADAITYASELGGYPVIVKPNRGSMGRGVSLVDNDTDLMIAMQKTLEFGHACLVQGLVSGQEWRLFCLEGEPRFMYRKVKPFIKGNGQHSFGELLRQSDRIDMSMLDRGFIENALVRQSEKFVTDEQGNLWNSVLKDGEVVEITITGNLASGSSIADFSIEIPSYLRELSSLVYKSLKTSVMGIDFFSYGEIQSAQSPVVIEVNGNPSLRGAWEAGHKELCLDIWQDIMLRYFNEFS